MKKKSAKKCPAVLFDFDNTIAKTGALKEIRETGEYDKLTPELLATISLYDQVPEILAALRAKGVPVGIVTNSGSQYVTRLLEHFGLTDSFDVVVTYSDVKAEGKKPSPKGIQLALKHLGVTASADVLYVGDDDHDQVAAYRAGITPVFPTWASRKPISTAPAMELSSQFLIDQIDNAGKYKLFAEHCAELESAMYERAGVYFLPLDLESNVVSVRSEMTTFCLGRYFSQRASTTALLHDKHALSKAIAKKGEQNPFEIPDYWIEMLAHVVRHGPTFAIGDGHRFDVVSVIPGKLGGDPRLERMLEALEERFADEEDSPEFIPDLLYYLDDARSQKSLQANERRLEAQRALHLKTSRASRVIGKRVLLIDDVVTTGSTIARGCELIEGAGASRVVGLALAKTVSIFEDERPCSKCGRPMRVQKNSQTGERFWGCSGYFDSDNQCKHSEPFYTKKCPKCSRDMRIRVNSRTQEKFWGCTGFRESPQCSHSEPMKPGELDS